jgi:hypothetical protein
VIKQVIRSKEEVEEILLQEEEGEDTKNIIEEKKPEWKATADTKAVNDFFTEYTKKMTRRRNQRLRDEQKEKAV